MNPEMELLIYYLSRDVFRGMPGLEGEQRRRRAEDGCEEFVAPHVHYLSHLMGLLTPTERWRRVSVVN